jgi:O-antigen ligase
MLTRDLSLRFRSLVRIKQRLGYYLALAQSELESAAVPLLALSTLVLAAAAGLLAAMLPLLPESRVKLLAGLPILFLAFKRPHCVLLLLLILSSTFVEARNLPYLFGFSALEWCVILLLGLVVTRALSDRGKDAFVRTPLDWPVFLFFLAGTISLISAVYTLGTVEEFRNRIWRTLLLYLVFFAVTNLVRTRRQLMTLVGGMFVVASVVAAFMVLQQAVGPGVNIIPGQYRAYAATALGQELKGVARVSPPGALIVFVMLLPAFVLHVTPEYLKGHKWLSYIPVVLLPPAIAFTFDRNMWLGAISGSIAFILISRLKSRRFVSLVLVLAVGASLLVSLLNVYFPRIDTVVEGLSARFNSLFAGDELVYDASTQWRLRENELAVAKIKEYPVLGIGPSGEYRPSWSNTDKLTGYVHNAYLFLLVDVGIVGFLPLLWLSVAYLARGICGWHTLRDPVLRGLVLGFVLSFVALLVSNLAAPRFLEMNGALLVGVILGISEVAIRLEQPSSQ